MSDGLAGTDARGQNLVQSEIRRENVGRPQWQFQYMKLQALGRTRTDHVTHWGTCQVRSGQGPAERRDHAGAAPGSAALATLPCPALPHGARVAARTGSASGPFDEA